MPELDSLIGNLEAILVLGSVVGDRNWGGGSAVNKNYFLSTNSEEFDILAANAGDSEGVLNEQGRHWKRLPAFCITTSYCKPANYHSANRMGVIRLQPHALAVITPPA